MSKPEKLLRLNEVIEKTTLGRNWIRRNVEANNFPAPIKLSERAKVWRESEVDAWIEAQAATNRDRAA